MYFILRCSIPASAFGAGHSTSYHWIEGLALRLVCTSQMSMCMHTHDYYETNPDNTIARRFNFSFNNCSSSGSVNIRIERNDVVFGNVHFEPSRIARRTQSKCSLFLFGWMSDSACECLCRHSGISVALLVALALGIYMKLLCAGTIISVVVDDDPFLPFSILALSCTHKLWLDSI